MKLFKKGFTLIELLVVIGILAILLAITLIAINPARQFAQSNNTKRRSDVNAILNAIHQFAADNRGVLPAGITNVSQEISDTGADLCTDLVDQYLAGLPVDPQTGTGAPIVLDPLTGACPATYTTNYFVEQISANNRVTVSAPGAELGELISVTR